MRRILFALCLLTMPATAQATTLIAGGSVTPADATATYTTAGGSIAAQGTFTLTGVDQLTGNTLWTATVREVVYRTAAGTLDFQYQLTDSSSSTDTIHRMVLRNYGGYSTDVSYVNANAVTLGVGGSLNGLGFATGAAAPTHADRDTSPGSTIGFDANGSAWVAPNSTSSVMVIHTNATTFGTGSIGLIDGVTVTNFTAFSPTPEPGSIVLLAGCLSGLGLNVGLRRFRKTAPAVS